MFDLYAAVFGSVLRARAGVENVVRQHHAFAKSLPNVTVFLRTGTHTVEIGLLRLDASGRVINVPKGALNVPMFRQFMPKQVEWNIVQESRSEKHPTANLNSDFVSYLDVIVHLQSCSLFFVPPSGEQERHFLDGMRDHAQAIIHSQFTEEDLQTLRAFLVKSHSAKAARA